MLIFLLIFAVLLRLINLNQSLWLDEAVQAIVAKNSLAFAFEELKGDFHPPLFHLLMHYWVRIFGSSEIVLRIPSVLFGVGTVWIVYKIGKLGGLGPTSPLDLVRGFEGARRLGTLGALFLATAPFHIYYSQESRMYSMTTFFASLSVYYFIKVLTGWRVNEFRGFRLFSIHNSLFILSTTLALYSDYYALFVLFAEVLATILFFKKKSLKTIPLFLIIGTLFIPVAPLLLSQLRTGIAATGNLPMWGKLVNLNFFKALPLTFIKFSLGKITIFNKKLYGLAALGVLGIFGGVGGYGVKRVKGEKKDKREIYLIILLWLVVPVLAAWVASLVVPNYQPFRLLLVLPAFYLLLAYGVSMINTTLIYIIVLIMVLVVNATSLSVYYRNPYFYREDWRNVAALIKQKNTPIVISAETFDWPLVYYGVGEKAISVVGGNKVVNPADKPIFLKKVAKNRELLYTPYLADLYDPQKLTLKWLEEVGFVKIKEVSFNQIPVLEYTKNEDRY